MRRHLILALVLMFTLLGATTAQSAPITIVDTGYPLVATAGVGLYHNSLHFQFLAGQFRVESPVTVTSAEGWIGTGDGGRLDVGIHSDIGLPGDLLYSETVNVLAWQGFDWRGPTGVNWFLPAGTYWISFIPQSTPDQWFGGMLVPAPFPLAHDAYWDSVNFGSGGVEWIPAHLDLGVRILGKSAEPVPEPASLLLFGSGLVGLRAWRKRCR